MIAAVEKAGQKADLFTPDGFVAGQMIVQAIKEGGTRRRRHGQGTRGLQLRRPQGQGNRPRPDHALVQDMYQVKLVQKGGTSAPSSIKVVPGDTVAPPEKK